MKLLFTDLSQIYNNTYVKGIMSKSVLTLDQTDTIRQAMDLLSRHKFSTLVIEEKDKPVGIITEKDILQKVILKGKDPEKIKVGEVMDKGFFTIHPEDSLLKTSNIMERKSIKKMIVINGQGQLVGIVTETDIVKSFNAIYKSYKHLLWNPIIYVVIFFILLLIFLADIIFLR